MSNSFPKLALISPCLNEELMLEESAKQFMIVLDSMIERSKISEESFVYFVDDGSKDNTWSIIERLHQKNNRIRGIKLSRNFGQQNAVLAGLLNARDKADCFVTINSDLQDDLMVIEKFIDSYAEGYEVVYGVKKNTRKDSFYKKCGTIIFRFLMNILGTYAGQDHSDFRFASKKAINALAEFGEVNVVLEGLFPLVGFKTKTIDYKIHERVAGESKFSFIMLAELAWDAITSFSVVPMRLMMLCGLIVFVTSMVFLILLILRIIAGSILTWMLFAIFLIGGLQIIGTGIVGEYIGKIHKETKSRPRYIVEKEL